MPFIAAARPSPGSAALTGPCSPSAVTAWRPAKPLAPITRCTRTSLFRPVPDLRFRVASECQGEAGLPLVTPSVLAQTVATFPPVVGDGQRPPTFGPNSIPPHEIWRFRGVPRTRPGG